MAQLCLKANDSAPPLSFDAAVITSYAGKFSKVPFCLLKSMSIFPSEFNVAAEPYKPVNRVDTETPSGTDSAVNDVPAAVLLKMTGDAPPS